MEFGGHINLNPSWGCSLAKRMKDVGRKAATAKSSHSSEAFSALKSQFLTDVTSVVEFESIPAQLVFNWDQT